MIEVLLNTDPSFRGKWEAFQEKWRPKGELPLYLALSDFACHLIQQLEAGDIQGFGAVFDAVELCLVKGDRDVRETTTVGLLEDLQNANLHRKTRPEDFLPWLQPETLRFWKKVHDFWVEGRLIV